METLTDKQARVLRYIEHRLREGPPPTQRQIARHFGLSQNAVYQTIRYLRQKGYLTPAAGHRNLRLSEQYGSVGRDEAAVPVVGHVAAGEPILAEQNIEDYVDVQRFLGLGKEVFCLRVRGDSMIDAGILDGDLVVVRPGATLQDGQIAVVLLDDEATVKRVFFRKDRIALQPANAAAGYRTRYIRKNEKDVRIVGRVIGCLRRL